MLQFFRKNDPYRLISIFLILLVIRGLWLVFGWQYSMPLLKWTLLGEQLSKGFVMYKEVYDYTGPLAALAYKLLNLIFGASHWWHIVLSTLLIIYQSAILNFIFLRNKAYAENNYLPALLYVIVVSSIPDFFVLSPQLMSLTFVILALGQVFKRIDNQVRDELFLYAGLYVSIAIGFYIPSVVYFVVFLFALIAFSSAVIRRLVIYAYGFLIIQLIIVAYFYWNDALGDYWVSFVQMGFFKEKTQFVNFGQLRLIAYVPLGVLILSLSVLATARSNNFQQNMMRIMAILLVAAVGVALLSSELTPLDLLFFMPSLAFLLAHYFLNLKRKWVQWTVPYLIMILLWAYPMWLTLQGHLDKYLVEKRMVASEAKTTMVVGADLKKYLEVEVASPFLDSAVSVRKLQGLDVYFQASGIYKVLDQNDPEIIIDDWGYMPKVFNRFPLLERKYVPMTDGTYLRKSDF